MSDDLRNDGTSSHKGLDTSPLRDAIAQLFCADDNFNWAGESWDVCGEPVQDWWRRMADAVLAMPEIVDMLALRRMCGDLTVEQVARALRAWSFRLHSNVDNWCLNDDEKALAAWREPT